MLGYRIALLPPFCQAAMHDKWYIYIYIYIYTYTHSIHLQTYMHRHNNSTTICRRAPFLQDWVVVCEKTKATHATPLATRLRCEGSLQSELETREHKCSPYNWTMNTLSAKERVQLQGHRVVSRLIMTNFAGGGLVQHNMRHPVCTYVNNSARHPRIHQSLV